MVTGHRDDGGEDVWVDRLNTQVGNAIIAIVLYGIAEYERLREIRGDGSERCGSKSAPYDSVGETTDYSPGSAQYVL